MRCDFCAIDNDTVINYRQRTNYTQEENNWVNACPECKDINDSHWDERWKELYVDVFDGLQE